MSFDTSIQTNLGSYFDFDNPQRHMFPVREIAHSLSNLCRFTGHVREFYSVAQHSVIVSLMVPPELKLAALFHDAAEAYIGDCATPLKRKLGDYKAIQKEVEYWLGLTLESRWQFAGLNPEHPLIKQADLRALYAEKRDLMSSVEDGLHHGEIALPPYPNKIVPLLPKLARRVFIQRFITLIGEPTWAITP